jgi:hypothetical protein
MPAQVLDHEGYHEIRLSGRLLADLVDIHLEGLENERRILIDYSEVTEIGLPAERFVQLTRQTDASGSRIAIYAPSPLAFGWNRQVLQLAGVREGVTVSVFKGRDQAIAWLVSDGGAEQFGGSWRDDPPFLARLA